MTDAQIVAGWRLAVALRKSPFRMHWLMSHGIIAFLDLWGMQHTDLDRMGL
jgi:hypothetical protein